MLNSTIPWHYHPTSEGRRAKTIDKFQSMFYGDGVVIDRAQGSRSTVNLQILKEHKRSPILFSHLSYPCNDKADKLGDLGILFAFSGLRESTLWLCNKS
jgi:hypothetical protein